jgi:peptidoglycan/LPS O-acetylase OafA/YrhL
MSSLPQEKKERISYLDGLRGIAIMAVVFFHAYACNSILLEHGGIFSPTFIFKYGNTGVFLFFLISGFVILSTLERSSSFFAFLTKRYLRLLPAMICAVVLVYIATTYLPQRESTELPELRNIIAPLTFIHPFFFTEFFGIDVGTLEGPFWTLYLELIFYVFFGVVYFLCNKTKAVLALAFVSLLTFLLRVNDHFSFISWDVLREGFIISRTLGLEHVSWFTAGALGYLYYQQKSSKNLVLFIIGGLFAVLSYGNWVPLPMFALFILAMFFKKLESFLSNKIFVFFGFISYPLYLIHDIATYSLVEVLYGAQNFIPVVALPLIPITGIIGVSYVIARYGEPPLRRGFLFFLEKFRKLLA